MLDIHRFMVGQLWLGTEATFHSLMATLQKMSEDVSDGRAQAYAYDDAEDENNKHFLLDIQGNTAIIEVKGKLVAGVEGSWGAYWGVVGYGDIRNAIVTAINDDRVDSIVFDYDTPGGEVNGIQELSDFIKTLPGTYGISTSSYSGGTVASGGLWLSTASEEFKATAMAEIGSLGVIAITAEMTEMYKEMGISIEVFKSTPLKAAGNPYEKMTDEMRAVIQANIDETDGFFVQEIATNRGLGYDYVKENIANGKTWYAAEAQRLGLIDGIGSFESILLALRKESADNHSFQHVEAVDMARRKKILDEEAAAAIASGVPVDKVIGDVSDNDDSDSEGADSTADDSADGTDGAGSEEGDAKSGDEAGTDEAGDTSNESESGTDSTSGEDTQALATLTKQLEANQDKMVDLKVELKLAQAKLVKMEAAQEGFMKATAAAIQRNTVAVGGTPPSTESLLAMDAGALLVQYEQTAATVAARYGAGKQVTVTVNDDEDPEVDAAAQQLDKTLLKQAQI